VAERAVLLCGPHLELDEAEGLEYKELFPFCVNKG